MRLANWSKLMPSAFANLTAIRRLGSRFLFMIRQTYDLVIPALFAIWEYCWSPSCSVRGFFTLFTLGCLPSRGVLVILGSLLSFDSSVLIQPLYIVFDGLSHRIFSALTRGGN